MPSSVLPVPTIIQVAKISQYLATLDRASKNAMDAGFYQNNLPELIYMERKGLENKYIISNLDPSIPGVANYVYALCGPYNVAAQNVLANIGLGLPVVSGPTNQSVLVGATAVFAISVTSLTSYIIQWYQNGVLIPGATGLSYSKVNCQLTDSNDTFDAVVTNSAGSVTSQQATLTVSSATVGYFYYSPSNPYPTLQGSSDPFVYQVNFVGLTFGQPFSITLPSASSPNMYLVVKVPTSIDIKANWFNTALNNGTIPDFVWYPVLQFSGFTYYVTRNLTSMDTTQTLKFS